MLLTAPHGAASSRPHRHRPRLPPRRPAGADPRLLRGGARRIAGPDRPQRRRQDHLAARAGAAVAARGRDHRLAGRGRGARPRRLARAAGLARPSRRPQGRSHRRREHPDRQPAAWCRPSGRLSDRTCARRLRPAAARQPSRPHALGRPAPPQRARTPRRLGREGLAARRAAERARHRRAGRAAHRTRAASQGRRPRDRRHACSPRRAGHARVRALRANSSSFKWGGGDSP